MRPCLRQSSAGSPTLQLKPSLFKSLASQADPLQGQSFVFRSGSCQGMLETLGELPWSWVDHICVSWLRGQCLLRADAIPLLWLKADGHGGQAAQQRLYPVTALAGSVGLALAERESPGLAGLSWLGLCLALSTSCRYLPSPPLCTHVVIRA